MSETNPEIHFEYKKPPETYRLYEKEPHKTKSYLHRLELKDKGGVVSFAELEYHNDPFPFYYVDFVSVDSLRRGQGFGSAVIEQVNQFLKEKAKAGLLESSISPRNPAYGLYERHGWQPVPNADEWFSFNLPKNLPPERILKAIEATEKSYRKIVDKAA